MKTTNEALRRQTRYTRRRIAASVVRSNELGRSGECKLRGLSRRGGAKKVGCGAMREGREKNVQDAVEVEGEEGRCGLSDERVSLDDGDPQAWSGQSSNIGPSIHSSIRQGPALPYCSVAEERRSGEASRGSTAATHEKLKLRFEAISLTAQATRRTTNRSAKSDVNNNESSGAAGRTNSVCLRRAESEQAQKAVRWFIR